MATCRVWRDRPGASEIAQQTGGPKAARIGVAMGETYPRIILKQSEQ